MARPRQFTDEEILETTREVVLRDGPNVSTNVIAEALGVSQASLFKRFGTKACLITRALLPSEPFMIARQLSHGPDARPIDEQLVEMAGSLQAVLGRAMPLMVAFKNSGIDIATVAEMLPTAPPPVVLRLAIIGWLQVARDQGRVQLGDAEAAAQLLLGALVSRAMLRHILGERAEFGDSDDEFVAGVVDTLWNGLRPVEAT